MKLKKVLFYWMDSRILILCGFSASFKEKSQNHKSLKDLFNFPVYLVCII